MVDRSGMAESGSIAKGAIRNASDVTPTRSLEDWPDPRPSVPNPTRALGRPVGSSGVVTRERIIGAARQVFSQRGFRGATMEAIAERSGVTRESLRHYFENKHALYDAVVHSVHTDCFTAAVGAVAGYPDLAGRLSAFITELIGVGSEDSPLAPLVMVTAVEAYRRPGSLNDHNDPLHEMRTFIADCVAAAVTNGDLGADTNQTVVVDTTLTLIVGVALFAGFSDSDVAVEAVVDQLGPLLSPP